MIKKAKEAYNRRLLEQNKNDTKAFRKTAKKIIPTETLKFSV